MELMSSSQSFRIFKQDKVEDGALNELRAISIFFVGNVCMNILMAHFSLPCMAFITHLVGKLKRYLRFEMQFAGNKKQIIIYIARDLTKESM